MNILNTLKVYFLMYHHFDTKLWLMYPVFVLDKLQLLFPHSELLNIHDIDRWGIYKISDRTEWSCNKIYVNTSYRNKCIKTDYIGFITCWLIVKGRVHGIFFIKSVDSLPCMWWEYKDESMGRYRVVSSTIVLSEMQERVSCKCKTI